MSENAITRRSFLAGSAGAAAAAAATGLLSTASPALAEDPSVAESTDSVHTLCDGCSNHCGYTAYSVDGKLDKLIGDAGNPSSGGRLCARGYGYSQVVYSPDRLTEPMKKTSAGTFEPIDWDAALTEIAALISDIDPEKFGVIGDGNPSVDWYGVRLVNALGTNNFYLPAAARNMTVSSALQESVGIDAYEVDYKNAKAVVVIGAGSSDELSPAKLAALNEAAEGGAKITFIDPRRPAAAGAATDWMPVKAGTEGAVLLAIAHQIVTGAAYDTAAVEADPEGFAAWREELQRYTPTWASTVSGLSAAQIEEAAASLINAAPAAAVDVAWRGSTGTGYANGGEAVRTAALINTLLGCWGVPGGAFVAPVAVVEDLEGVYRPISRPANPAVGSEEYLTDAYGTASDAVAVKAASGGELEGLLVIGANPVMDLPDPAFVVEALSGLKLLVTVSLTMDETAELADYVLPPDSYLERAEIPVIAGGVTPTVSMRNQALDRVNETTRDIDEIICGIAQACGFTTFDYAQSDLIDAQCAKLGLSREALAVTGTSALTDAVLIENGIEPAVDPRRISFASENAALAGYGAVPTWNAPVEEPEDGTFRLLCGDSFANAGSKTVDVQELADILNAYGLDRLQINTAAAEELGIADGDTVVIENGLGSAQACAEVTDLIEPGSVYLVAGLGATAPAKAQAAGFGINPMQFVAFDIEPLYGAPLTQEAVVTVKKAGA